MGSHELVNHMGGSINIPPPMVPKPQAFPHRLRAKIQRTAITISSRMGERLRQPHPSNQT